jgi:hypothetical protein
MTNPHCSQCKTGLLQLNNHYALKEYKTITRIQFIKKAQELGAICFSCIHNGRKDKSKRMQKYFPNFKALDMLEPVIKSKFNCPMCGYFVVGIIDEKPLRLFEYCLRDGCKFKRKTEVINAKQ